YVAEAGMTAAAAAIFQNPFEARWYKQGISRYGGFSGTWSSALAGGTCTVVAEDVVKATLDPKSEKSFQDARYNRIDIFSRGTYEDYSVVLYQAIVLMPEEPVYEGIPATMGTTGTQF